MGIRLSVQKALQARSSGSLRVLRDELGVNASHTTLGRIRDGQPVSDAMLRRVAKAQPPTICAIIWARNERRWTVLEALFTGWPDVGGSRYGLLDMIACSSIAHKTASDYCWKAVFL